jgi:oligopeptide/dipeptide ABC transporter ATP-binding protein
LITHDLGVVAENAHRVGVMYAGRLVEEAPVEALFADPRHPYTSGLLRSMPGERPVGADRRLPTLPGSVPDPADPPAGCRFHPRCAKVFEPCATAQPPTIACGAGRSVSCFLHDEGGS